MVGTVAACAAGIGLDRSFFGPGAPPQAPVLATDVVDLVDRLARLTRYPDSTEWYRSEVQVTFYRGSVLIRVKTQAGNEFDVRGRTLGDAVAALNDSGSDVRAALAPWLEKQRGSP